jgi:hypothetical protein
MKKLIAGFVLVLGVGVPGLLFGATSAPVSNSSGASDNTLMQQTHDAKAQARQKQAQVEKGGRPASAPQQKTTEQKADQ